jgi:hypothetical protein
MKKIALTLFLVLSIIIIIKASENIYMFSSTSYTVCSANFYDGEGPAKDYLNNQDVTVTLYPSTPGGKISVTFNSFNTQVLYSDGSYITKSDILYVYDGNSLTAPQIGAMQGVGYGTVSSTASDGSLTFRFVSHTPRIIPSGGTRAGWSATVSCSPPPPVDITMIGGTFTTCGGNFYDAGGPNGDYWYNQNTTLTLYPSTPGAKISVTFDSFNTQVQYSDGSYITKSDILYVYDGNSTLATQIGAMQGIGYGTVTSTAVDGSLTFKFVAYAPKVIPESGTRAGWSGKISCSSTPPDEISMIGGTFTTCGGHFYDAGGPNGDYWYNQNTTLTLYPSTPGSKISVTFDSFNTQVQYSDGSYITKNDILYVYNGNSISAPQIGSLQGQGGLGTIKSTAADGSLTFQFVSYAPKDSPPSGTRAGWSGTISCSLAPPNDISMIAGSAFTTCGGRFYDSGGPNGDYMNNQNSVLTLYPATPGAKISVTFDSFNTQVLYSDGSYITKNDILYVYNGNSISAPQIGSLQGQGGSGTIKSTAADGSLTFQFVSYAPKDSPPSGTRAGWSGTISCNSTPPKDINMIAGTAFTIDGGRFYDSGGPNGDYMNNQNSILTLYPSTSGAKVSVTFDSFNTQVLYSDGSYITKNDVLSVYDGNSIKAPQIGELKGNVNPITYNSSAADGSLTFWFVSYAPKIYPASGVRSGWSASIKCDINATGLTYPKITQNLATINVGQSIAITGIDFKPSGTAKITIIGPSGFSQSANNISTDGQGSFKYIFYTSGVMPTGIYNIYATDNISGLSAPLKQFSIKSTSLQTSNLIINSPLQSINVNVNEKFLVEWQDKMVLGKSYTLNGSKRNYKYTIELSENNGTTWKTIKTIEGQQYIDSWVKLNFSTSITSPGSKCIIRITDSYNINNSQNTPIINVNQTALSGNLKVDLKWDFSYPQPSFPVEGIAADGTARIFLNLSKINSGIGSDISSVKVALSDNFNRTDPTKLGKVKVATKTSAYDIEANETVAITTIDNTAKRSGYIFWYIAPDDFAGDDPADIKSSFRFVKATFNVNYSNGTTEKIEKLIRIVRPPLMLVHGLASDASTWDYFRHNALGYELKFIDDFRFNTCIPINIHPDASFITNAFEMTIGNPSTNTFQGVILNLRNKGFAANRVDYVCHSMGGCVLRSIYDNYYSLFTRTGNASSKPYKNYEKGYVNKVIMIGTPNNSSPWADIVNRYAGDLPYPWVCGIIQSWYGFSGADKPLPLMYMQPEDNNAFIWTYKASDAVKDMQIDDAQGGVNFRVTNTKAHLIAGDFFPGAQYNTNGLIPQEIINFVKNTGDEKLQDLLNYFLKIACKKESNPVLHQELLNILNSKVEPIEKALAFLDKMALVMDAFNLGTFIPESDLVVSVGSQLAGYAKPTTNGVSNVSAYDNFVGHAFIRAETKNIDIGNMVNNLLNQNINSDWFDIIPATPANKQKSKSIFDSLNDGILISKTDTNKLHIIKPKNNSTAFVDSSFHVQFNIKDTTNLESVNLIFQNRTYNVDSLALGTIDVNIQINSNLLDNQQIILEGYYLYPDSAVFVYDQININITNNDVLTGFGINPKILFLFKNQIKIPEYYVEYQNSVSSGNFSPDIRAEVNDTSVIKFDLTLKGFKGIKSGETYASISYKGFTDTLYFVVEDANIDTITVGISEHTILPKDRNYQSIKVYPNPTTGIITLEGLPENEKVEIAIYNMNSKLVKVQTSYSSITKMDISDAVSGVYLLVINNRFEQVVKIIKK